MREREILPRATWHLLKGQKPVAYPSGNKESPGRGGLSWQTQTESFSIHSGRKVLEMGRQQGDLVSGWLPLGVPLLMKHRDGWQDSSATVGRSSCCGPVSLGYMKGVDLLPGGRCTVCCGA